MKDETNGSYVVSRENWSLHRKGYDDQKRHSDKVKEAIRNNLPDLISEESIVMSDGREVIKIPIRSLDEYKIRYNHSKSKHVGQGDGDSKVGDVIAKDGSGQKGKGGGKEAGEEAGSDYYEAEISLAELEETLFSELELPDLQQKDEDAITKEDVAFTDVRKTGLIGNIDKKRTLVAAFKRNAMEGSAGVIPIINDDLRYKTYEETVKPHSKAVVFMLMDTSASMGKFEKYMARSFYFWMMRFLRNKYEKVEIEFIAHHTMAKVVTETEFFTKGESGGTICSTAYEMALTLIETKYSPSKYNIYTFHFSDGENMTSDNSRCVTLIEKLMEHANLFGYGEVNEHSRYSTLLNVYQKIDHPKFRRYVLKENRDVYHALRTFFHKRPEGY